MEERTLIIGAGQAGEMVAREILDNQQINSAYRLVGFLDDDPSKKTLLGFPVYTGVDTIKEVVENEQITTLIIAIPSATREEINRIIDRVVGLQLRIKIVPGITEIIEGNVYWKQVRDIKPEDLLGREEIAFEQERITPFLKDKVMLVTGGGGSIGSEICRQLLRLPVKKVIALGHGETSLYRILQQLASDKRFSCRLCDIGDTKKISRIMKEDGVDMVYHAAAHKHVPLMESFPDEAVKNNILGTLSVAKAALENGVSRFLLVSTDKAVNPTSSMGASKRIAEQMILGLNGQGKTSFVLTRFGNVLGSRGSVLPLFQQQIDRGGPVTVTHQDIERYFMSITEAARLVIKASTLEKGDVFVLDMGRPIRIYDLAKKLIRLSGYTLDEMPIRISGLRPGEKMYEELLTGGEDKEASSYEKLFIATSDKKVLLPAAGETFISRIMPLVNEGKLDAIRKLLLEYAV